MSETGQGAKAWSFSGHSRYWRIKWYGGRGRFDTPGKYFAAHRPQGQHPLQGVLPLHPVREWRRRHWRRRSPVSGVWLLLATKRSPVSGPWLILATWRSPLSGPSPQYHYMTLLLHTLSILK